jgi:hypothetical protein
MSDDRGSSVTSAPRTAFGALLLLAWGAETALWLASTVDAALDGDAMPVVTGVAALALLLLLAGMEGLEVAVIDRWRQLYPERTTSQLAAWLAARQLFVALIVTTATLLARRPQIIVPGGGSIENKLALAMFDLTWLGLTVLWFAQILPKHLAATNPDRYLSHLRRLLFPVVELVRRVGVSQPGEWAAYGLGRLMSWMPAPEAREEVPFPREPTLAGAWRALVPESPPPSGADPHGTRRSGGAPDPV